MAIDELFAEERRPGDFAFDAETASVFDDMLSRSVPFYDEMQRMLGEIAADFAVDGTGVYDLGCSTGETLLNLDSLPQRVRLIGLDASQPMLEKAKGKLASLQHPFELVCGELDGTLSIENASVVVMSLTLQFVRPLHREGVLRSIYNGLNEAGCLLMIEKIVAEQSMLNRLYIDHYYTFKARNGYSAMEISQKREALENVLIPYRVEENMEMLRHVGFRTCDIFFKWYNFAGILALK